MLDENTKIKLPHVFAMLVFLGSIFWGWTVTISSINSRLDTLEENSRNKDQSLTEIKTQVKETDNKVDRLMMAFGVKPVEE